MSKSDICFINTITEWVIFLPCKGIIWCPDPVEEHFEKTERVECCTWISHENQELTVYYTNGNISYEWLGNSSNPPEFLWTQRHRLSGPCTEDIWQSPFLYIERKLKFILCISDLWTIEPTSTQIQLISKTVCKELAHLVIQLKTSRTTFDPFRCIFCKIDWCQNIIPQDQVPLRIDKKRAQKKSQNCVRDVIRNTEILQSTLISKRGHTFCVQTLCPRDLWFSGNPSRNICNPTRSLSQIFLWS